MINAELIRELLEEELTKKGLFLVGITVTPLKKIVVYIDSMNGVTIDECTAISRYLESKLNRDIEVFELEVSSPGLDKPLKLPVQFEKNVGRMLNVLKYNGITITGRLLKASNEIIQLDTEVNTKDNKTGKKRTEHKIQEIKFEEIKKAKVVISLKK